jgi:hypothetical protein
MTSNLKQIEYIYIYIFQMSHWNATMCSRVLHFSIKFDHVSNFVLIQMYTFSKKGKQDREAQYSL